MYSGMSLPICGLNYRDNTAYNTALASARCKPHAWAARKDYGLTTKELQDEMGKVGIKIAQRTLEKYAERGLITRPDIIGNGRAGGVKAQYKCIAPAEVFAAYRAIHGKPKLSPDLVAHARKIFWEGGNGAEPWAFSVWGTYLLSFVSGLPIRGRWYGTERDPESCEALRQDGPAECSLTIVFIPGNGNVEFRQWDPGLKHWRSSKR